VCAKPGSRQATRSTNVLWQVAQAKRRAAEGVAQPAFPPPDRQVAQHLGFSRVMTLRTDLLTIRTHRRI
jgi:hypothetical protein